MKKMLFILTAVIISLACNAQKRPLTGSGTTITKTFDFADFTKVALLDLDGKATITIGNTYSITATIDDNLAELLTVESNNGTLTLRLANNYQNKLYVEDTKINITITTPTLNEVKHRGNGNLYVNGIRSENFTIKNTGNGNAYLQGTTTVLDIICRDNGSVYAESVTATKQNVRRSGNGNVYTKAANLSIEENNGNGEVVTDAKKEEEVTAIKNTNRVNTTIINTTNNEMHFTVKYPVKGSYGITVKANDTLQEAFPVGTKL